MCVRILLVTDCSVSCDSLQNYFLTQGGEIEIETVFASGGEALVYLNTNGFAPPHLILFVYDLPDMFPVQFAADVQGHGPAIPLVVYRAPEDEEVATELLNAGVLGYVLKSDSLENLMTAVRAAVCRKPHLSADLAIRLWGCTQRTAVEAFQLNARERDILLLVGEGLKNSEIACRLNVAKQTVKNNVTSLRRKLEVENRTQLMCKARSLGLWLKRTNYTGE